MVPAILIEITSLLHNLYGPEHFTALTQRGPISDNDSFMHITGCPQIALSGRADPLVLNASANFLSINLQNYCPRVRGNFWSD